MCDKNNENQLFPSKDTIHQTVINTKESTIESIQQLVYQLIELI